MQDGGIATMEALAQSVDYSFTNTLLPDPCATDTGVDHAPREVKRGHYVPVVPMPLPEPEYVAHSKQFFQELELSEEILEDVCFSSFFSGDLSCAPAPMRKAGWATGYALSIYGTEYYNQCPFGTGNGYGDGRAISVLEGVLGGKRWEMQLKGGGPTPYCRGADGRAVLRSSVREFLAQEHMHALGVPTTRSLTLYASKTQRVKRAWYSGESESVDPDEMRLERVAITTRAASSFLRVGQIELFGRRARTQEHPDALHELEMIVAHTIEREYAEEIDASISRTETVLKLADLFAMRLTALVANWIRVGYCQGNFNSDNCAVGGFTLDYGPFGFCELFDPAYQPWTGGGRHFAFLNQPQAAYENYHQFCLALEPLLQSDAPALEKLATIKERFHPRMQEQMRKMWAKKLGLDHYDAALFKRLTELMIQTYVDYTIFFRELSSIPHTLQPLQKSFYRDISKDTALLDAWDKWLAQWHETLAKQGKNDIERVSKEMKQTNPKYVLREWHLLEAYESAEEGDYEPMRKLHEIMSDPYAEQTSEIASYYYEKRPIDYFGIGGISHISCSS